MRSARSRSVSPSSRSRVAGVSVGPALAADECNGPAVCLPVAGPWVVVPSGGVDYELACPLPRVHRRRHGCPGGDRATSMCRSAASREAPSVPGVTTRRSVIFRARVPHAASGPTSFRPFIGCIPTRGGGGRALTGSPRVAAGLETDTAASGASSSRRVVRRRSRSCGSRARRGSRLVGSTHAVAFRQTVPPLGRSARRRSRSPRRSSTACSSRASTRRPRLPAPGRGSGARPVREGTMTFGSPFLLASLARAARWPSPGTSGSSEGRRVRRSLFPNLAVLAAVAGRSSWKRHLVAGAAARHARAPLRRSRAPARRRSRRAADRATVVLVVDVSVSMNATDVAPTRLEAARTAIRSFVDQVPARVKVGLVAFSDEPVVMTTPTTDRRLLRAGIASLPPGYGTAIGDAVARAVELVRGVGRRRAVRVAAPPGKSAAGAVVLLSDGAQTRGVLHARGGRATGAAGRVSRLHDRARNARRHRDRQSRRSRPIVVPVPPDRPTLARIAEATGGSTFEATDADAPRLRLRAARYATSRGRRSPER